MLILDGLPGVASLHFAADGTRLIVARITAAGGVIDVWSIPAGERIRSFYPFDAGSPVVVVHPAGELAFLVGWRSFVVISLADGVQTGVDIGSRAAANVVLSPDGEWLVVEAGLSPRHALVGLRRDSESEFRPAWEVEVGRPPEHLGGFFGTGDRFVAVGHGQVVVRDAATGAVKSATRYPSAYIGHRAVSPDGSRFAVMGYGNLYVWDTAKWGKPKRVEGHSSRPYTSFAFHPTKPLLITVQRNQTLVKFLDTTTWKPVAKFQWKLGEITSVAFSPDGTLAAAGSSDGKIVVWDVDA